MIAKKIWEQWCNIALNVFYAKKEKIYPTYVSRHTSNHEKQNIILMTSNGERCGTILQYKKLSALLRGIMSKDNGYFYCLNCPHYSTTKYKLVPHKEACENNDFCNVIMSSQDTKILEFHQYQKFDKVSFSFCPDLECIIETSDGCKNNLENLSIIKVSEHISLGFSRSTIS